MPFMLSGITISLVGVLVAGALPLVWRNLAGHRAAQVVLAVAAACGAFASIAFLAAGSGPSTVFAPSSIPALRFEVNGLSAVFLAIVNAVACLCAIFAFR